MREPNARTSRLAMAAGVIAFIAIGGGGFLLGRATAPQAQTPSMPVVIPPPPVMPRPAAPRLWGRAELLDLVVRAADAAASAQPLPQNISDAVGQRFDLALPFGCTGPSPHGSPALMRWHYDAVSGVLRIHAMPISWEAREWNMPQDANAAEGFWIDRPWSTADSCPSRPADAPPATVTTQDQPDHSVAIAQFADIAGNDLRPKGRPFEKVLRVPSEELDATRGFRLRLIGRIGSVPGGGPVRCIQPDEIDQRPACVVAMVLSELRLENPTQSAPLAIWDNRSTRP